MEKLWYKEREFDVTGICEGFYMTSKAQLSQVESIFPHKSEEKKKKKVLTIEKELEFKHLRPLKVNFKYIDSDVNTCELRLIFGRTIGIRQCSANSFKTYLLDQYDDWYNFLLKRDRLIDEIINSLTKNGYTEFEHPVIDRDQMICFEKGKVQVFVKTSEIEILTKNSNYIFSYDRISVKNDLILVTLVEGGLGDVIL